MYWPAGRRQSDSTVVSKTNWSPTVRPAQEIMAECAQLSQFDDELYKVTGGPSRVG
jgi:hypothetical protein